MERPEEVASDRPQRNVKCLDSFSARRHITVNRVPERYISKKGKKQMRKITKR